MAMTILAGLDVATLKADLAELKLLLVKPQPPVQPQVQPVPPRATENSVAPSQPQRQSAAPKQRLNGLAVLNDRCAKCHGSDRDVDTLGGGFTMLKDGKIVLLTDKQMVKMYKFILGGKMPKPPEEPLTQEEGQAALEYIDGIKLASAEKKP